MADKLERTYNVPLRRGFIKVPNYKKAKKAVSTLKQFMVKHMKVEEVKIGPELNKKIWANGIKNPPHHVKVTAVKEEKTAKVELEGVEFKTLKPKKKEEKKAGLKGKLESLTKKAEGEKPAEKKAEAKKPTLGKKETAKTEAEPKEPAKEKKTEVKTETPKTVEKK
jgi:large subunit ribosomal protein L31e